VAEKMEVYKGKSVHTINKSTDKTKYRKYNRDSLTLHSKKNFLLALMHPLRTSIIKLIHKCNYQALFLSFSSTVTNLHTQHSGE